MSTARTPVFPYKLDAAARELVLERVRQGSTLLEAAASVSVNVSTIRNFSQRSNLPEAVAFAEELSEARRVGLPRRASRFRGDTASRYVRFAGLRDDVAAPVEMVTVGGMQVPRVRSALELFEVGFLLGQSVLQVRELTRRFEADPADSLALAFVLGVGGRRLVQLKCLAEHPLIVSQPLAIALLARLAEGRLDIPRPASDRAIPEGHIVVLRGLQ